MKSKETKDCICKLGHWWVFTKDRDMWICIRCKKYVFGNVQEPPTIKALSQKP